MIVGKRVIRWAARCFFLVTIVLLAVSYVQWFRIAPSLSVLGIILLFFYSLFVAAAELAKSKPQLSSFLAFVALLFFFLNWGIFSPFIAPERIASITCGGETYIITRIPNFEDRAFYQLTVWKGPFDYRTSFVGNNGVYYSSKLVCNILYRTNEGKDQS